MAVTDNPAKPRKREDIFRRFYVMEWLHQDGWVAIEGSFSMKTTQRVMRENRAKSREDKFRIRKYLPQREPGGKS